MSLLWLLLIVLLVVALFGGIGYGRRDRVDVADSTAPRGGGWGFNGVVGAIVVVVLVLLLVSFLA